MCLLSESADFSLSYTSAGIATFYLIMSGSHPVSIYSG